MEHLMIMLPGLKEYKGYDLVDTEDMCCSLIADMSGQSGASQQLLLPLGAQWVQAIRSSTTHQVCDSLGQCTNKKLFMRPS